MRQFEKICKHPAISYQQNWQDILTTVKRGNLITLGTNPGLEDLRKLPLTDYQNYKDDFTKSLETKINPYTLEPIHYWANSTGTSGKKKTLPLTPKMRGEIEKFSTFRFAQLVSEFNLMTVPPEIIFVLPGESQPAYPNLPIGVIGYYYYKNSPDWMSKHFIFSKKLYQNEVLFNKWYVLMSLLSDATGISTPVPAKVIHFLNELNHQRTEILQYLVNGNWPKELTNHYSEKRIEFLKVVLQKPVKRVKEIWPSLQFISLWMSGESCKRQLRELQNKFDFTGVRFIDQVYNASEGIFNLPLLNEAGGPINPVGLILEFYDQTNDKFYWPWELELNKCYEPVLTNSLGLIRYRTYDQVICTGYFESIAKIAFHSRTPHEISLGWGTIKESELEESLYNSGIEFFSQFYFTLNKTGNGIVMVSDDEVYENYLPKIEENLALVNPYYAGMRDKTIFTKIVFEKISTEDYHSIMAKNMMNKRLFILP